MVAKPVNVHTPVVPPYDPVMPFCVAQANTSELTSNPVVMDTVAEAIFKILRSGDVTTTSPVTGTG